MFTLKCLDLPLERKEEIKDLALAMRNALNNYINSHPTCCKTPHFFLDKSYSFFKYQYGDVLNKEEKCIFNLFILFPDDEKFNDLIERYNKDFVLIGNYFNINSSIVKLRYFLQKTMTVEKEQTFTKAYKKQQN